MNYVDLENILGEGIFQKNSTEIHVFIHLIRATIDIYRNYVATSTTSTPTSPAPNKWKSIKTNISNIFTTDSNQNMLAKTFGAIVNGSGKMPQKALSIVDKLFIETYEVSGIESS